MKKKTEQMEIWKGEFGKDYTDRNFQTPEEIEKIYLENNGFSRTEIYNEFFGKFDRSINILEVGCNVGNQLQRLQKMGFTSLYGIDIQKYALDRALTRNINATLTIGSAFDIPYENNFFDLVFTSGVLIHLAPDDINGALKEIYRSSKRYIYGYEYFAEKYTEIVYRGKKRALWKTNFTQLYLKTFNDLKIVKEKKYTYQSNKNLIDISFLLEKKQEIVY